MPLDVLLPLPADGLFLVTATSGVEDLEVCELDGGVLAESGRVSVFVGIATCGLEGSTCGPEGGFLEESADVDALSSIDIGSSLSFISVIGCSVSIISVVKVSSVSILQRGSALS